MKLIIGIRDSFSSYLLISLIGAFYTTSLFASPEYWPTNGWRSSTPEQQGMDSGKLIEMLEKVRDKKHAIDSITIVRNGYIVTDAYIYPFQKDTKHVLHSVTKSVTSALVGIALDKGKINSVNQPALEFFPEKTFANLDKEKRTITLEHLLTMTSGFDAKDSWLHDWAGLKKMRQSNDWAQYVLDLPMAKTPGEYFEYSNGVSHLLSAIIQNSTNMSAVEYAKKYLFGPLGITDFTWPSDPHGITFGGDGLEMTPHDMAKLGQLYLNKGRWEERQIISEDWVKASTRRHIPANAFDGYGYQWWTDSSGYYMAVGYGGQFIYVVPEKNMVVVFTSNTKFNEFPVPQTLLEQYIIPAAVDSQTLAAQENKQERLDLLLAKLAEARDQKFIWISEEHGIANNGEFSRSASPAFRFTYPKNSLKESLQPPNQEVTLKLHQVMNMKTLREGYFSAWVNEIPEGVKLAEIGTKILPSILAHYGSDIQLISNEKFTLADDTIAYRTEINWKLQSQWDGKSLYVSAFKDGKWVGILYWLNTWDETAIQDYLNEGNAIIESLTFE